VQFERRTEASATARLLRPDKNGDKSNIEISRPNCLILIRFVKTKEQTDLDRLIWMLRQLCTTLI